MDWKVGMIIMDNKTIIRGWSITEGDYMHSRRLEKEIQDKEKFQFKKSFLFPVSLLVALGSFFVIIGLLTHIGN